MRVLWLLCFVSVCGFSQPKGMGVRRGEARISKHGKEMTIATKGMAIIRWDEFNVAAKESLHFAQASAQNAVLNRVVGGKKSKIFGNLTSNGKVYLLNGAGIHIGAHSMIKTAGFLASTGKIADDQFLKGGDFSVTDLSGKRVMNEGKIVTDHGDILLVASKILNKGQLIAPEGCVGMAAGVEVIIKPAGRERFCIRPAMQSEKARGIPAIVTAGDIQALITEIKTGANPSAQAIMCCGKIEATSIKTQNGRVHLVAEDGLINMTADVIAPSGQVVVRGGHITRILPEALIDVSHDHPGAITIGGSDCGYVNISKGATFRLNGASNGGSIEITARDGLRWEGHIEARGNRGGVARICTPSAKCFVKGTVSMEGANGVDGKLVIDPKFVSIWPEGSDPVSGLTFGDNPAGSSTISGSALSNALASASVTIQANTDIYLGDVITGTNDLILEAGRSIQSVLPVIIDLTNASFSATINDAGAIANDRDSGLASLDLFGLIKTNGGNVSLNVGSFGGSQMGAVNTNALVINAGGGNISIHGFGTTSRGQGVTIGANTHLSTSGSGAISITGQGGAVSSNAYGVNIIGNSAGPVSITADDGNIELNATAGGSANGAKNFGAYVKDAEIKTTGSGLISIQATGGLGTEYSEGFYMTGSALVTSTHGNITLVGEGGGAGPFNYGVRLDNSAAIQSLGPATVTVTGNAGGDTECNVGTILSGGVSISSAGGNITVSGTSAGNGQLNQGIRLESGAKITAMNAANVICTGVGAPGPANDNGIAVVNSGTAITSVNGDITLNGTGASGSAGIYIDSDSTVAATGSGTVIKNSNP